MKFAHLVIAAAAGLLGAAAPATPPVPASGPASAPAPSMADILAAAPAADWQLLDADRLLVMTLADGHQVLIYLAPAAAPNTVRNIQTLARANYYAGTAIVRAQDNYVVQWGDPAGDTPQAKSLGSVAATLKAEFDLPQTDALYVPLAARDAYADAVGFWDGFPAARDTSARRQYLAHCYAMVGVGRGETADSGTGAELYVVIGHAPRHLDRNVTVVGRVIAGIEHLSALPRGTGALGFYEKPQSGPAITSMVLASSLPAARRPRYERLATASASFAKLLASRKDRRDGWFLQSPKAIDLCNVPLPVRAIK